MPFVSYDDITDRIVDYYERCFDEELENGFEGEYDDFVDRVIDGAFNAGLGFVADFDRDYFVRDINIITTVRMMKFIGDEYGDFELEDAIGLINTFAYFYIRANTPDYQDRFNAHAEPEDEDAEPEESDDEDTTDTEEE